MRHHSKKIIWLVAGFCLMAAMALSPASAAEKVTKSAEPCAGQAQLCPPTPEKGTCTAACTATIDCPAIKTPGTTTCQATIDCPPAKPAQPGKEKKKK